MSLTRRAFVGAAAAVSLSAVATSALADAPAIPDGPVAIDWLGTEPADPEGDIVEIESDVVVVGLGWAGVCATRSACEAGASVNVFEKGGYYGLTRQNVNAWGSKLWLELFPETERYWDKAAAMRAVTQSTLNRASDAIQSKWFDTNGEAFDWFFAAMEGTDVIYGTAESPVVDTTVTSMTETSYPYPKNYDPSEEYYPCFPGCAKCYPTAAPFFDANMEKAQQAAGDKLNIYRNTTAIKLIKEDGRIAGIFARSDDGTYYKATAHNGIILATGDFFSDKLMVNAMLSRRFPDGCVTLNSLVDANGNPCDMGDGHRMGAWAGARIQLDGVNMSHAIGGSSYTIGTLPTLFLDKNGKRYMNEDVQGQQHAERIWELKDCVAFQIFDAGLFDHMDDMPYGHGKHPEATLEAIQADAEAGKIYTSDTIEGLLDQLDIDKEAALASIEHYNELCHNGADTDYGKCAKRMIPIENPPFFCDRYVGDGSSNGVGHLVTMSGLESDEECHVYDEDMEVIPGLYVAGNVQGNRFAVIYPEVLQGHSIAMAMTFGYIAGKNAAAGV